VDRVQAFVAFAGGELALVALAGVLLVVLRGLRPGERQLRLAGAPTLFDRRFVAVMALGPILLTLVAAVASGLAFRPHWGFAMWSLIGLFGVIFVVPRACEGAYRRFVCAWAVTLVFVALLYIGVNILGPYAYAHLAWDVLKRYQKEGSYPTGRLAAELTRRWHERVGAPLAFVIGSKWIAGHVSFLSEDHPLVLRDGNTSECPWIDADELGRRGAAVAWEPGEDAKRGGRYPGWLADSTPEQRFPAMEVQPPIVLPWATGAALPPLRISWGILYPTDRRSHSPRPSANTEGARDE